MNIYQITELNATIIFMLTWFPIIYKVIIEKSAKSFSSIHLITLILGFISNAIYTFSFEKKYIFIMYLFDIFCILIIIFFKIFFN